MTLQGAARVHSVREPLPYYFLTSYVVRIQSFGFMFRFCIFGIGQYNTIGEYITSTATSQQCTFHNHSRQSQQITFKQTTHW